MLCKKTKQEAYRTEFHTGDDGQGDNQFIINIIFDKNVSNKSVDKKLPKKKSVKHITPKPSKIDSTTSQTSQQVYVHHKSRKNCFQRFCGCCRKKSEYKTKASEQLQIYELERRSCFTQMSTTKPCTRKNCPALQCKTCSKQLPTSKECVAEVESIRTIIRTEACINSQNIGNVLCELDRLKYDIQELKCLLNTSTPVIEYKGIETLAAAKPESSPPPIAPKKFKIKQSLDKIIGKTKNKSSVESVKSAESIIRNPSTQTINSSNKIRIVVNRKTKTPKQSPSPKLKKNSSHVLSPEPQPSKELIKCACNPKNVQSTCDCCPKLSASGKSVSKSPTKSPRCIREPKKKKSSPFVKRVSMVTHTCNDPKCKLAQTSKRKKKSLCNWCG